MIFILPGITLIYKSMNFLSFGGQLQNTQNKSHKNVMLKFEGEVYTRLPGISLLNHHELISGSLDDITSREHYLRDKISSVLTVFYNSISNLPW